MPVYCFVCLLIVRFHGGVDPRKVAAPPPCPPPRTELADTRLTDCVKMRHHRGSETRPRGAHPPDSGRNGGRVWTAASSDVSLACWPGRPTRPVPRGRSHASSAELGECGSRTPRLCRQRRRTSPHVIAVSGTGFSKKPASRAPGRRFGVCLCRMSGPSPSPDPRRHPRAVLCLPARACPPGRRACGTNL